MVGREEQRRVLPKGVAIEVVQQLAEIVVACGHERGIVGADLRDFFGGIGHLLVHRPVEHTTFPAGLVLLLEARRCIERFVRIEALQHHEPVVRVAIEIEEFETAGEAARQAVFLFVLHELAIDRMLQTLPSFVEVVMLGRILRAQAFERRLDHRFPRVVFLAANEVPGAEAAVVRRAAVLEIMHVIGDEVRMNPGVTHHLRKGIVERLERAPAAVHEIQPPGVQVATSRHAREAADEVGIEGNALLRKAIEIRRSDAG